MIMKKFLQIISVGLFILLTSSKCLPFYNYLEIECNAPYDILCIIDLPSDPRKMTEIRPEPIDNFTTKANSHNMMRTLGTWEKFWSLYPDDTVSFFFFHKDTVEKYSWDEIRQNNKLLVRYDIGVRDLAILPRYTYSGGAYVPIVPYPPVESMRAIHMYPPYDQVMAQYEADCQKIAAMGED